MLRFYGLVLVLIIFGAGQVEGQTTKAKDKKKVFVGPISKFKLASDLRLSEPTSIGNLAVVTIKRMTKGKWSKSRVTNYISFEEAAKRGRVSVRQDKNCSRLTVRNFSARPLYIMAGEMVYGGMQDRVFQDDLIIPPFERIKVKYQCVEKSRYLRRYQGSYYYRSGKVLLPPTMRNMVSEGRQGQVWDGVKTLHQKFKSGKDDHSVHLVYRSIKVKKQLRFYERRLAQLLSSRNTAGMIVTINDHYVGTDFFTDPRLFHKVKAKLIRSYALQALLFKESYRAKKDRTKAFSVLLNLKTLFDKYKKKKEAFCSLPFRGSLYRWDQADCNNKNLVLRATFLGQRRKIVFAHISVFSNYSEDCK